MALPYVPIRKTVTLISGAKGSGKSSFVGHLIRLVLELYSEYYVGDGYDSVKFMPFAGPLYSDLSNFLRRIDNLYSDFHYNYINEDSAFYPYAYDKQIIEEYLKSENKTKESLIYSTLDSSISYRAYLQQLADWYKARFGENIYIELLLAKLKNFIDDSLAEDHIIIDDVRYLAEATEVANLCDKSEIDWYWIHVDVDKVLVDTHSSESNYDKLRNVANLRYHNKFYADPDKVAQVVYSILRPRSNNNVDNLRKVSASVDADVAYVLENLIIPYLEFLSNGD